MKSKKSIRKKITDLFQNQKVRIATIGVFSIAIFVVMITAIVKQSSKEEPVYRETDVAKGNLTVGVQIDGNIEIGTTTQALDLDLSAYTGSSDFSFTNMSNMSSGGGVPNMSGMGDNTGSMGSAVGGGMFGVTTGSNNSSTTASGDRTLAVEAIYVSAGQVISKGDPLVKLSEDSVNEIKSKLEEDVTSAEVTYKQQTTEASLADLSAQQTLESNKNQGTYAQTEYDQTVSSLQEAVDSAQEKLDEAKEKLTELEEQLTEYEGLVSEYQSVLDNANYTASNINVRDSVYGWTTAENAREDAQYMYDALLENIDITKSNIKTQKSNVAKYESSLASALNDQTQGIIEAKATYDKAMLNYNNAEEIYDVDTGKTILSNEIAYDDYLEAKEKLDEFNSSIDGQTIVAKYDGVVTDVPINTGDYIGTGTELVTVNDYNEVTVTVSVEESNIEYAGEGSKVNVYIDALPDEYFTAEVTEVGDASYDSSSAKTYYEITVTLSGNTKLLYEGMNTEVTFITKESEEVIYVSNRAIIREDGKSFVRMKDEKGNVITREVITGFSDGNNVEIKSGLEEGDVVLIESKVSD